MCFFSDSKGVWIEAFLRSSNNESLTRDCKSLDPQLPVDITSTGSDSMYCLYYNRTAQIFLTDSCDTKKTFICEHKSQGNIESITTGKNSIAEKNAQAAISNR
jgi:hypothetical protein